MVQIAEDSPTGVSLEEGRELFGTRKQFDAGGILDAIALMVPKSTHRQVPRLIQAVAKLPLRVTLPKSHMPRMIYFPSGQIHAAWLQDAKPVLSTELNNLTGVAFVSMTLERSDGPARTRVDPAPPWLIEARRGGGGAGPHIIRLGSYSFEQGSQTK
jgi:hypothetical protein